MEASELLKKALTLPDKERADLAASLIDSLDTAVDDNVEAAWQEEITRRMRDIDSGNVKAVPWKEVEQKAHKLLHGE